MEDRILYSGGEASFERFTAEFSASAQGGLWESPPMDPEMFDTTDAGEGPSSGGGA